VRNAWNGKAEFAVSQGARWTEHTDFVSASFGSRKLPSRLHQAKGTMFKKLFSKSRYAKPKDPFPHAACLSCCITHFLYARNYGKYVCNFQTNHSIVPYCQYDWHHSLAHTAAGPSYDLGITFHHK
jgi:hypothetical protein